MNDQVIGSERQLAGTWFLRQGVLGNVPRVESPSQHLALLSYSCLIMALSRNFSHQASKMICHAKQNARGSKFPAVKMRVQFQCGHTFSKLDQFC